MNRRLFAAFILFAILLVTTAATVTIVVHAAWTASPTTIAENTISGITTRTRSVRFTTPTMFQSKMQSDRLLFPGKCVSNNPDQPYGWTRYREELMPERSVTVSVTSSGTIVQFNLDPRMGYTTNVDETITCGPLEDPDGNTYAFGGEPPDADKYLSFSITYRKQVNTDLFQEINITKSPKVFRYTALPTAPQDEQMDESMIRQNGFVLDIAVINDVWREEKVKDIAAAITCSPNDCLAGFIKPRHIFYDTFMPNVVSVRVPRDEMRKFNIKQISKVTVQLPDPTKVYVGKDQPIVQATNEYSILSIPVRSPTVTASAPRLWLATATKFNNRDFVAESPTPLTKNMLNISEDCLRGKVDDETACPRLLFFLLWKPASFAEQDHRFAKFNYHIHEDIRAYTLTSSQGFDFASVNWAEELGWIVIPDDRTQAQAILRLNRIREYDTAVLDMITITLPFTCFTTLEAPEPYEINEPLRIFVTPSPGAFAGGLRDIEQRDIWFSNVELYLILDGESWKPSIVNFTVRDSFGDAAFGWNAQKMQLVDAAKNGSIAFASNTRSDGTPTGKPNMTTIKITLAQNPDYEMITTGGVTYETVQFLINTTMIQSGLTLRIEGSTSLRIHSSPGTYTLDAPATVEEVDVKVGGFTMELSLAGQKFLPDITLCAAVLCAQWTSSSTTDTDAWVSKRAIICNTNNFVRVNNRTLRITWAAAPSYDTIRGETITTLIPTECTGGAVPAERPTITVLPQNGNVTFGFSLDGGVTRFVSNDTSGIDAAVTESVVRMGAVELYFDIVNDTWDDQNPNVTTELPAALISTSNEPFGWNNKKPQLIKDVAIVDGGRSVRVRLQLTTTYDITGNETIELTIPQSWVSSRRAPKIPTVFFRILASAGSVELKSWFGATKAPQQLITEDDVRWGRVWFEFSLLGDQWRRDTNPFVKSFSSDLAKDPKAANTSMAKLIPALVPSIQFFRFTQGGDGSEVLRLQLQSSALYDISVRENITLQFVGDTVVSGIAPFFFANGKQLPSFSFLVHPTPGRLVLSGAISSVNEKKMRQSSALELYLTLFGETWNLDRVDNTTTAIIENVNAVPPPSTSGGSSSVALNPNGFVAFKASILPKSRVEFLSPRVLLLHLAPNRNYEIASDEWIEINIPDFTVSSGLTPFTRSTAQPDGKLRILVRPTGGELRIHPADLTIDEDVLRQTNFTVSVAVDGDQWSQTDILDQSVSFVADAFGSQSSIIKEEKGFNSLKENFLNIGGGRRPFVSSGSSAGQESTLRVRLNPEGSYDINEDEVIQFSVNDPVFLNTKLLPDPATVQLTVRAKPRTIVLVIDQSVPFAGVYRNNLNRLAQQITNVLGVPTARLDLKLNATSVREDGMLVVNLKFLTADTNSLRQADPRTLLELTDTFLSIKPDYLYKTTAIRFAFMADSPPSAAALIVQPTTTTSAPGNGGYETEYGWVYAVVGVLFVVFVPIGFVAGLRLQRARVATSALKSSRQKRRDEGATEFNDEMVLKKEKVIELSVNPLLRNAGLRLQPQLMAQNQQNNDKRSAAMRAKSGGFGGYANDDDMDNNGGPGGSGYYSNGISSRPLVVTEPTSLRNYVRNNLGLQDPEHHIEEMKPVLREVDPDNDKYLPNLRLQMQPSAAAAASSSAGGGGDQPAGPRQFTFRSRTELKRLEKLMDLS